MQSWLPLLLSPHLLVQRQWPHSKTEVRILRVMGISSISPTFRLVEQVTSVPTSHRILRPMLSGSSGSTESISGTSSPSLSDGKTRSATSFRPNRWTLPSHWRRLRSMLARSRPFSSTFWIPNQVARSTRTWCLNLRRQLSRLCRFPQLACFCLPHSGASQRSAARKRKSQSGTPTSRWPKHCSQGPASSPAPRTKTKTQ